MGTTRGHTMTATPRWYESYRAAALETDWTKMEERVRAAEFEIHKRQHLLFEDHGGTPQERYALASALNRLWALREDLVWWQNRQRQNPVETSNSNSELTITQRRHRKRVSGAEAVPNAL